MSGTHDEHDDWVRRLLASHEVGPMPDDVLARLEHTMARVAAERTAPPAAAGLVPPPAAPPVGEAAGRDAAAAAGRTGDRSAGSTVAAPVPVQGPHGSRRERRREETADRRRLLGRRLLPVAAGVVVLGLGAVTVDQVLGDDEQAEQAISQTPADSGAADTEAPTPRGLVATGTDYTSTDLAVFEEQVADLVAVATGEVVDDEAPQPGALAQPEGDLTQPEEGAAGSAPQQDAAPQEEAAPQDDAAPQLEAAPPDDAGAAGAAPVPDAAAARSALPDTPLSDPEAYSRCATEVTDGDDVVPLAIDLATVDGIERAVVVVPDRTGEGVFVYVTSRDCDASTDLDFYPMTPDVSP